MIPAPPALTELAARQDALGAELEATGLTDFNERQEWLAKRRSADERLVWDRKWSRLPVARVTQIRQPRMTADEVVAELEWLVTNGLTGEEAAVAVGRSRDALARFLYRRGRPDLARIVDWRATA